MNIRTPPAMVTALPPTETGHPPLENCSIGGRPTYAFVPDSRVVTTSASSGTLKDDFEACRSYRDRLEDPAAFPRRLPSATRIHKEN